MKAPRFTIRMFAVLCVAVTSGYVMWLGDKITNTLSGPGWCATALGAGKASSVDGTPIKGLEACVGLLTIQLKSLSTDSHILLGTIALSLGVLITIVIAAMIALWHWLGGGARMRTTFGTALTAVLVHEGGYVDNPHDKGGPTNRGVTQHVYSDWLSEHGLPDQDVKVISPAEVLGIYKSLYWNPVKGDQLPTGLDYAVFDFAVNSGTGRACRYLQQALGVVQDGVIGPNTLAVVAAAPATAVIDTLCDLRLAYVRRLNDFRYFGGGWTSRISDVRAKAKAMAS